MPDTDSTSSHHSDNTSLTSFRLSFSFALAQSDRQCAKSRNVHAASEAPPAERCYQDTAQAVQITLPHTAEAKFWLRSALFRSPRDRHASTAARIDQRHRSGASGFVSSQPRPNDYEPSDAAPATPSHPSIYANTAIAKERDTFPTKSNAGDHRPSQRHSDALPSVCAHNIIQGQRPPHSCRAVAYSESCCSRGVVRHDPR